MIITLVEVTKLEGLKVYTEKGILIGTVEDIILDFERGDIYGLYIASTNPDIVENGMAVSIPYRLVKTVGDVIILKGFPEFVKVNEMK